MPSNTMQRLENIKLLQNALTNLKSASGFLARANATKSLTDVLTNLGYLGNTNPASLPDDDLINGDLEDGFSDNTNDANYRYADTGYISGSHKEQARNRIKELAQDGQTVKDTDIEWDEIEADPLLAESVIKKSNIMGNINYQAMKDGDGDAATAFMIQKVLASIAPTPHWDLSYFVKNTITGQKITKGLRPSDLAAVFDQLEQNSIADQQKMARKAYVTGINSLKARIINIKDIKSLVAELKLIASEMGGFQLSAGESDEYLRQLKIKDDMASDLLAKSKKLEADYSQALEKAVKSMDVDDKDADMVYYHNGEFKVYTGRVVNGYFKRRAVLDWLNAKDAKTDYVDYRITNTESAIVGYDDYKSYVMQLKLLDAVRATNSIYALKNDMTSLAWVSLGERFWAIIELTSAAFVKHANAGLRGKYNDWGLVIPKDDAGKPATKGKKKKTFELIVADNITRIGGDPVTINSTSELKSAFGFRDIQSGSWVLNDKDSAKFHVENAAASMLDLSDVVGIDPQSLAFGGRLALAFGARGRSGALAHYESDRRVINITKMKGGGSLGHEWFHAIDNILGEVMGIDGATGAGSFLSQTPSLVGDNVVGTRFKELQDVMTLGVTRSPEKFAITQKDVDLAILNVKDGTRNTMSQIIFDAKDAQSAVLAVDDRLQGNRPASRRTKNHNTWRKIAAAYHSVAFIDQTIYLNTGERVSQFYANSKELDAGKSKPYWSSLHEMAARSFQAFLEDSLKNKERRNDYLSFGADNALYSNHKAYPEGEERKLINAAFERLFKTIKEERIFENASKDQAMMDSIFGANYEVSL